MPSASFALAPTTATLPVAARAHHQDWLRRFYAGERATFDALYREYLGAVERSVGSVLGGADRQTVTHEVFYHLLTSADSRQKFEGGNFAAWVTVLARNRAIDFVRRRRREQPMGADPERLATVPHPTDFESRAVVAITLDKFQATVLPKKWSRVFDARFVRQLEQSEAARMLGMSRTTLAYQEYRIRALLRRFLL